MAKMQEEFLDLTIGDEDTTMEFMQQQSSIGFEIPRWKPKRKAITMTNKTQDGEHPSTNYMQSLAEMIHVAIYSTFGTLVQLSEHKFGGSEVDDIESVNTQVPISDLKVFEELGHATSVKRIVENKDVKVISLELDDGSDKEILVYKNNLVIAGSDFIGYIRDHVPLFGDDLSAIHPEFGTGPSRCLLKDKDTIEFVYRTEQSGEHRIRVKHPWNSKKSYLTKYSNSKQVGKPVSSKKTLEILIDALETGCRSLLKKRYNITIYNNGGDVINNYGTARDEEKPARSESALIQAFLAGNPGIVDIFKFCDNGKANNFDGLFVCSSVSGVWKKTHNARVEQILESRLKKYVVGLTESETRIIESHSNIQALRKMFVKEIYDDEFEEKIDENLDIFALLNGVYDLNLGALRRTNPQDYALTCTGWKYDEGLSVKHMDEVVDFFRKILPIEEERHIVLTFIASLLHGHRFAIARPPHR
ncbi:MAG: hypothetical protein JOS17DRAFT_796664 [Linnemannia elongata]|nr:MAG: hypothetical protein JOS17DRAFT_796664 [Linnemannia elongata]